jgi:HEAT repeat protein
MKYLAIILTLPMLAALALPASAQITTQPATAPTGKSPMEIQQALADLASPDWIVQMQAMNLLAKAKSKDAVAVLKTMVTSAPTPYARGRALVTLAEMLKTDVLQDAIAQAAAPQPEVRAAALEALGVIGDARGEATVAAKLKDPTPIVQQQALVSYARLKKAAAYPTIVPLLKSDPQTVRFAARALTYVATPDARTRLLELMEHTAASVRIEASDSLASLQEPLGIPILLAKSALDPDTGVRLACEQNLRRFGGTLLATPMLNALKASQPALYVPAVNLLAMNPTKESCDELAKVLASANAPYESVLPTALRCLYEFDAPRYLQTFTLYLPHKAPEIRGAAVEGVLRCPKADHFELLKNAVSDANRYVAIAAINGLAKVAKGSPSGGCIAYFTKALAHEDIQVGASALVLMKDRLTKDDFAAALTAFDRQLSLPDETIRNLAAGVLDKISDDDSKIKIAAAQSYLTHWMVIGPMLDEKTPLKTVFAPEKDIDFKKKFDILPCGASMSEAPTGGRSLQLVGPAQDECKGKLQAVFQVDLPAGKPALKMQLFQRTGWEGEGAVLAVRVNGQSVLEKKSIKAEPEACEVDLSAHAGKPASIEFVLSAGKGTNQPSAFVIAPTIAAEGKTINLLDLLPKATAKIIDAKNAPQLAWVPCLATTAGGSVSVEGVVQTPATPAAALAVADVQSPKDQKVTIFFVSPCSATVTLNSKSLGQPVQYSANKVDATLVKGLNRLVVKIENNYPGWYFTLRIAAPDGKKVPFTMVVPTPAEK